MKILIPICFALLTANAYSQDMLAYIQGKWKVDVEATKALPELKPRLNSPMLPVMLNAASQSAYEFKDSTLIMTFNEHPMPKVYKVIKNTADELVMQADGEGPTYVYKHDKGIRLGDSEKGKEPKDVPTLVMVKAK